MIAAVFSSANGARAERAQARARLRAATEKARRRKRASLRAAGVAIGGALAWREPYLVGYGKPPLHTRFKPGQSGNPRGRPRRAPT